MTTRRKFIKNTALGALAVAPITKVFSGLEETDEDRQELRSNPSVGALVLSTWRFGLQANEEAWKILSEIC